MYNVNVNVLNATVDMMNDTTLVVLDLNMDDLRLNMDLYTDSLFIERLSICPQGGELVT